MLLDVFGLKPHQAAALEAAGGRVAARSRGRTGTPHRAAEQRSGSLRSSGTAGETEENGRAAYRGYRCLDGHPAVEAYQERLRRDEEIKRRTGQLADDEEYDDWRLEHAGRHGKGAWELDDEEIEEMERQSTRRPPPTRATRSAN